MTGKDLLMTLVAIDEAFYEEAEKPIPSRRKRIAIAVLVAALLLLAGCSYAVLTQAQWFQGSFGRLSGQPLSQGQTAYIEENVQPIGGQSVTVGHYRLTLESALAEERTACICLRLEGPGLGEMYSVGFLPRPLADGTGKEAVFFRKGRTAQEESPYVQGLWSSVSEGDSVSILLWLEQSFSSETPFEAGVPYILHLTDLEANPFGEPVKRLQEGEWDFEVVFDHLSREQTELLTEPVTTVSQEYPGVSLTLTSWKLRALGMDVKFEPGSQDYLGRGCLEDAVVVLKNGNRVSAYPLFYDPNGSATYTLDCPIDISEVDYVQLRDGTCLSVPEA